MELITFGKEVLQTIAEYAASYKIGQTVLRQLDRVLWVVEKSARWAVPPSLDQDEKPQPELVRPLPWAFFLVLLVLLRVIRDSVSLVNLVLGKPPLRSADVVMYIQVKRRYLRTLKYQGNRVMRARTSQRETAWYNSVQSLFEFTMCFQRYTNNNTRAHDENDQLLVVKRNKRGREGATSPVPSASENTMERLIEKMMVDLNADSDDDSSYTLTNANSTKTESDAENDPDTVFGNEVSLSTPNRHAHSTPEREFDTISPSPSPPKNNTVASVNDTNDNEADTSPNTPDKDKTLTDATLNDATYTKPTENYPENNVAASISKYSTPKAKNIQKSVKKSDVAKPMNETNKLKCDSLPKPEELKSMSAKEESLMFIQGEKCDDSKAQRSPKKKFANGRVMSENSSNKMKGAFPEKRELSVPALLMPPTIKNSGSPEPKKENIRH